MRKILEVKIGEHYANSDKCSGIGRWSSNQVGFDKEFGDVEINVWAKAECPACRTVQYGSMTRRKFYLFR
jgi:hypothetical protein